MKIARRIIASALILILAPVLVAGLASTANAATSARTETRLAGAQKTNAAAEALAMTKGVRLKNGSIVVTMQTPGRKQPQQFVLDYSKLLPGTTSSSPLGLLCWLAVGSGLLGLFGRIARMQRRLLGGATGNRHAPGAHGP